MLNCYAQMFFSKNQFFAFLVLAATFFKPESGIIGLLSVSISLLFSHWIGYDKSLVKSGLYSFNSLMVGLFMGLSYKFSFNFFFILISFSILCTILSNALFIVLRKYDLPILGLPFLISMWLLLYNIRTNEILYLSNADIYFYNELYAVGGEFFVDLYNKSNSIQRPVFVETYFRSLGAIYFQFNIIAGILIAIGLLFYSRIAFILSIIGYTTGFLIFKYIYGDISRFAYGYIGFNYILAAISIGGFYLIPSFKSYILAIIACVLIAMLHVALGKVFTVIHLPLFSLPGTMIILLTLLTLKNRTSPQTLPLVPIQKFQPEQNLYEYNYKHNNNKFNEAIHIGLPFIGTWTVSQGHHGKHTHKDDWAYAWDFIIEDENHRAFKNLGENPEDFLCYNIPVVAPANGYITHIVDGIEDNEIGKVDTIRNWGNTIIIKHAEGLYSKLSHLKKGSFKNYIGEYVYKGQVLAACGNSGRSPYPHIHFQIQSIPIIGAKTKYYPITNYLIQKENGFQFSDSGIPEEKEIISNIQPTEMLAKAFYFIPGQMMILRDMSNDAIDPIIWETHTNAYNQSYLYCANTNSVAYFVFTGTMFYFTEFIGDKESLLYRFFIGAHKLLMGEYPQVVLKDKLPIYIRGFHPIKFLQDIVGPFYSLIESNYESEQEIVNQRSFSNEVIITAKENISMAKLYNQHTQYTFHVTEKGLIEFKIKQGKEEKKFAINFEYLT